MDKGTIDYNIYIGKDGTEKRLKWDRGKRK